LLKPIKEMDDTKLDLTKPHISRDQIQTILNGIRPKKLEDYRRALVHKSLNKYIKYTLDQGLPVCSYLVDGKEPASNERLEYLGDSILNSIVGSFLYSTYPGKDEGFLTRLRTKIVRDTHCVKFSKLIGIGPFVLAGSIVKRDQNGDVNDKLLEDAFEAFLGAIFLDLGFKFANEFVVKLIEKHVDLDKLLEDDNYKDVVMRLTQLKGIELPEYKVISQEGPPHRRIFTVQIIIKIDQIIHKMGIGKGSNKKDAEQEAAFNTLSMMEDDDDMKKLSGRDL
jgi:ribonuclease-3